MNHSSKELRKEFTDIAKKYHMTLGIVLFEEKHPEEHNIKNRAIIFTPDEQEQMPLCRLADLIQGCLDISHTFRKIMEHFNKHSIAQMIGESFQPKAKKID